MNEGSQYSIHSICRICLNNLQNDSAYDLFLIPGLAKKLCVCTSLSVEPQDGFPKNLCGVCYTRLNDLHEFQKLCVDSVQKFQEMVANHSFDCSAVNAFDVLEATATNEVDMPGEDEDRINFDPLLNHKMELIENEEDVFKMLEHVDKEAEEAEAEIDQKERKFEDTKMFSDESSESEGDNDMDRDFEQNSDSDDEMPLAQRLRRKTTTAANKTKKKKDDSEDSWSESDDDKDNDPDAVVEHKSKPKRKRIPAAERHLHRIIECHICHQKFKKAIRYEEHMKYHNDLLPFQCKVETCKKGFTTASGLRMHVDHAHTELSEVHACHVEGCTATFPRVRLLTWHLRKVHNLSKASAPPRDHPCTECDKVFRCPMALKKHMYKHDGKELPFPCNICGKRFVINSALKDHLMRHAGIKNYVCPYCGVGKTTRQEWNTHILTHTQEKKFKCHLCEHASHNKQSLANHIKIVHEKIKNYACQYCGKTFGKSHACKIHEMTHTGEKRCECKVCGKKFLYPKSLTKHLKTHEKRVLRAIETYRKRQVEMGEAPADQLNSEGLAQSSDGMITQNATEELLKVCAESVATIPRDPRRVERVDIAQLAGTAVNPISSVSVPSWSPQVNFTKKEGKHICPGCGQGFNNIGNMKRHYKIIHEKVKDFACRFCPRRFAKAQTLKHHEWTHTGEKPYECKICGNRFRQDVALKRHQKVHENRPPTIPAKFYTAREELEEQERRKLEAKRRREIKQQAIAEAAKEQLDWIAKQGDVERTITGYDKYCAEKAAAEAEIHMQERKKIEALQKIEAERKAIAEAAFEQLEVLQKRVELEKSQSTYDGYYAQKAAIQTVSNPSDKPSSSLSSTDSQDEHQTQQHQQQHQQQQQQQQLQHGDEHHQPDYQIQDQTVQMMQQQQQQQQQSNELYNA